MGIDLADSLVVNDLMMRQEYEGGGRYAVPYIAEKAAQSEKTEWTQRSIRPMSLFDQPETRRRGAHHARSS
jgi:uncharacterized protein YfaP (DUF2135 family)